MTPRPPRSTLFPYTTLFRSLSFNPRAALSRNDQRQFGMGMVRIAGHQLAWIDAHERFLRLIHAVGVYVHESDKSIGAGTGTKHPPAGRLQDEVVDQAPVLRIIQDAAVVANQPHQQRRRSVLRRAHGSAYSAIRFHLGLLGAHVVKDAAREHEEDGNGHRRHASWGRKSFHGSVFPPWTARTPC